MLLKSIPPHFKTRRQKLMDSSPGSIFIFPAAEEKLRNPDVYYPFRQESTFHYLTGFDEPESYLVLAQGKAILFVRHRDPEKEMWEGERYGTEGAQKIFGADESFTIDQFDKKLPELLAGSERVYYRIGQSDTNDRRVLAGLETHRRSQGRSGKALTQVADPNELIGEMRLFKSPEEAALMREAGRITAEAHKAAMIEARPGVKENEIEALIDYVMRKNGCDRLGYGSIVAGGVNAACLHYRANNDTLRDKELLLIDAGGEYGHYTADITRTFPVGREFTPAQARAYDLVLKAQKECVAMTKPGMTLPKIHAHAIESMTESLLSLGLLKGNSTELIKTHAYRRYYPHGTSHWLGMDVHDVGLYTKNGEPRRLESGMCFTIEPGFYVQPGDRETPAEYHGIGIRIEDDVLVTDTGCEVLTSGVPKERDEIAKLRAEAASNGARKG